MEIRVRRRLCSLTYLSIHNSICSNRFREWLRHRDPVVLNNRTVSIGRYVVQPYNNFKFKEFEDDASIFTYNDIIISYMYEPSHATLYGKDRGRDQFGSLYCSYNGINYGWQGPYMRSELEKFLTRFAQLIMKFNGDYMVSY